MRCMAGKVDGRRKVEVEVARTKAEGPARNDNWLQIIVESELCRKQQGDGLMNGQVQQPWHMMIKLGRVKAVMSGIGVLITLYKMVYNMMITVMNHIYL